jgi:hypothetical protein
MALIIFLTDFLQFLNKFIVYLKVLRNFIKYLINHIYNCNNNKLYIYETYVKTKFLNFFNEYKDDSE